MAGLADPIKRNKQNLLSHPDSSHSQKGFLQKGNFTKISSFYVDLKTSVSNEEEERWTMSVAGVAAS